MAPTITLLQIDGSPEEIERLTASLSNVIGLRGPMMTPKAPIVASNAAGAPTGGAGGGSPAPAKAAPVAPKPAAPAPAKPAAPAAPAPAAKAPPKAAPAAKPAAPAKAAPAIAAPPPKVVPKAPPKPAPAPVAEPEPEPEPEAEPEDDGEPAPVLVDEDGNPIEDAGEEEPSGEDVPPAVPEGEIDPNEPIIQNAKRLRDLIAYLINAGLDTPEACAAWCRARLDDKSVPICQLIGNIPVRVEAAFNLVKSGK